ncbi:hypothetical protein MSAN_01589800 [Mycena sanguinolenta]|uniref:Uncharacterized protein n=1 Tax=Mycena sanguinolenta TaxID=230812 RepID=A0A8H6Y062_9AGAR|nr:hypothetical protein MSAN_01589800 [Mycena sanguinolenta]
MECGCWVDLGPLTLLCCDLRRRRTRAHPLADHNTSPHPSRSHPPWASRMGSNTVMYAPPPPMLAGSEYPATNAADFAPPPYVKKEPNSKPVYAPPPGPLPSISSPYSPLPGPPPAAHVRTSSHRQTLSGDFTNAGDFSGGFRPPPT